MPSQYDYNGSQKNDPATNGHDDTAQPVRKRARIYAPPTGDEPSAMPWGDSPTVRSPTTLPVARVPKSAGENRSRRPVTATRNGIGKNMKRFISLGVVVGILGTVALVAGQAFKVGNTIGGKQGLLGTWQGINNPLGQFPANTQRINILLIGKDYNHTTKRYSLYKRLTLGYPDCLFPGPAK